MNILLVGDIFSTSGREIFQEVLPSLKEEYNINFIVANGENIAHGNGITEKYYDFLIQNHVDVVTLGNHTFGNQDIINFIDKANHMIRPLNYPEGVPGKGYVTLNYNQTKITVFQIEGRTFGNSSINCPFKTTEEFLKDIDSDIIICDFHGEATSEKIAFGLEFDGRVNIIVGTHTHVQTNDAQVLRNGTVYMTDLGMTGALEGVIGVEPGCILKKFKTGMPGKHIPMDTGKRQFCGLFVDINEKTKKVNSYKIIRIIK